MKRHALFVGVNSYDDSSIRPLRFSVPDATILSDRFGRLGFKTRLVPDPTAAQMKDAVAESVSDLRPGDVFIFFFAGHGFTAQDGSHLLFCRDDRECLLRVNGAGVRVDAIEALSDCPGVHRAFFLDSCRTDSLVAFAMRGTATRDLDFVSIPGADQARAGSFFLLRSCDKFQPSVEIDSLQHGLFTKSLVDALDARDKSLRRCDSSFAESVGRRMDAYAANFGVSVAQRPSCMNAGPAFPLFPDSLFSPEPRSAPGGNVPPPVQEQHRRESIYPGRRVSPAPAPPSDDRRRGFVPSGNKAGEKRPFVIADGVTMDFRWCPATTDAEWKSLSGGADTFQMGSPLDECGRSSDEFLHPVRLTRGFWISETPVLQIHWENIMGAESNRSPRPKGAEKPVTRISWKDAQEFLAKARLSGFPVRLPTEAEWEYACRAGKSGPFGAGKTGLFATKRCDYPGMMGLASFWANGRCIPVRQFAANAWGLCDMHGNCGEWCSDWYGPYQPSETSNPTGPQTGPGHVVRGMRGRRLESRCRSASRWWLPEKLLFWRYRHPLVGFRIVLDPSNA